MRARGDWPRTTVGELCDFSSGTGFGPKDWSSSGLPIIRIQNLNGSRTFNHFDGNPDADWIVEPGDLLFAWAGVRGVSFGPTIWNGPRGVLNQHIYRVRPRSGVDKRWLYALLQHVTERIEQRAHGFKKSLVHVRKSDIANQVSPLPGAKEQIRIVSVIDGWRRSTDLVETTIAAKRQLRTALMQRLLTGRARPNNLLDPWPTVKLRAVTREIRDRNAQGLDESFVMGISKSDGVSPMRGQTIGTDLDRYKILPPGAFAYNPMRINIGSIARWPGNHHVLVSPDYVVFEAIPGKLDGRFLDHYRRSHPWKHFMEAAGNGGVRVRVYYNDLAALKLPLPPLTEQQRIADLLDLLDREISLLERQRELLEKQKRAVMHKLLTGEVRLATTE